MFYNFGVGDLLAKLFSKQEEADGEEVLLVEGERKTSEQFLSKLDAAAISVVNELLKLSPVEVFSKLLSVV